MSPAWLAVPAAAVAVAAAVPPHPAGPPAPEHRPAPRTITAAKAGPSPAVRAALAAAAACGALVLVGHLVGGLLALLAAAVVWRLSGRMESPAARRRREGLRADLPHVVDLMSACLAVGLSPPAALGRILEALDGPVVDELSGVAARLDLGVDPGTAWRDLGRHPQLGPLGRCVARSVESGASVAEAMTRLAEDLRRDARADAEARARSVGVRAAVPLGACLLPAFLLVGVVPLVAGSVPLVLGR
jgi:Flp pilus assembly protein TadB